MLLYGRKQHNIVKQLSSDYFFLKKKWLCLALKKNKVSRKNKKQNRAEISEIENKINRQNQQN